MNDDDPLMTEDEVQEKLRRIEAYRYMDSPTFDLVRELSDAYLHGLHRLIWHVPPLPPPPVDGDDPHEEDRPFHVSETYQHAYETMARANQDLRNRISELEKTKVLLSAKIMALKQTMDTEPKETWADNMTDMDRLVLKLVEEEYADQDNLVNKIYRRALGSRKSTNQDKLYGKVCIFLNQLRERMQGSSRCPLCGGSASIHVDTCLLYGMEEAFEEMKAYLESPG